MPMSWTWAFFLRITASYWNAHTISMLKSNANCMNISRNVFVCREKFYCGTWHFNKENSSPFDSPGPNSTPLENGTIFQMFWNNVYSKYVFLLLFRNYFKPRSSCKERFQVFSFRLVLVARVMVGGLTLRMKEMTNLLRIRRHFLGFVICGIMNKLTSLIT